MHGTGIDIKMEAAIGKIVRQYLSEEQIEENYQAVCREILPNKYICDPNSREEATKKCREMALNQIPKEDFTTTQIIYMRKIWGISI